MSNNDETAHEELERAMRDSTTARQVELDELLARMWQQIEDRQAALQLQWEEILEVEEQEEEKEE